MASDCLTRFWLTLIGVQSTLARDCEPCVSHI
jgi:hypothetical protein